VAAGAAFVAGELVVVDVAELVVVDEAAEAASTTTIGLESS
jgi:hypothetical protein